MGFRDTTVADYGEIDKIDIDGVTHNIDLSFKTIFKLVKTQDTYENKVKELIPSLEFTDNYQKILDNVIDYILGTDTNSNPDRIIDIEQDYRYIWSAFMTEAHINLNKDNLDWWEFITLLEGILLKGENTYTKVLGYRTYKKPLKNFKQAEAMEHKRNLELKQQYALKKSPEDIKKMIDEGIHSMFLCLKGRAKHGR